MVVFCPGCLLSGGLMSGGLLSVHRFHAPAPAAARLDYCNTLLHGTGASRSWSMFRALPSRLFLQARRRSNSTPLLLQLHWLHVRHRIIMQIGLYLLSMLIFNIRHTTTPACLPQPSHQSARLHSPAVPLLSVPLSWWCSGSAWDS